MAAEENKLDFFDDIKDKLVLLAVGLVSMGTIVPLFINNVHKIFHFSIAVSYAIFGILYFILPLVFFLSYYFLVNEGHDIHGLQERSKRKLTISFILASLGISFYFIYPGVGYTESTTWFGCAYIGLIIVLIFILLFVVIWRAIIEGVSGAKSSTVKKKAFVEFCIIGGCTLLLFMLLYLANITLIASYLFSSGNTKKAGISFEYFQRSRDLDTLATKFADLETRSHKNLSVASLYQNPAKEFANVRGLQKTLIKSYLQYTPQKIHREDSIINTTLAQGSNTNQLAQQLKQDTTFGPLIARLSWLDDHNYYATAFNAHFSSINKYQLSRSNHPDSSNFDLNYSLFRQSYYMKDYVNGIAVDANNVAKEKWVALMRQQKYKGLIWFLLLIMASLYWWLHLSYRLADQQTIAKPSEEQEKEINVTVRSISQVKSFIYVLFLLVLPSFKHIEKSDINLDKPFLNFGINSFSPQEPIPMGPGSSSSPPYGDDLKETNRLLQHIDNDIEQMNTSGSGYANSKFDSLSNEINDVAHQVIGSQKRIQRFDSLHPHLPKK